MKRQIIDAEFEVVSDPQLAAPPKQETRVQEVTRWVVQIAAIFAVGVPLKLWVLPWLHRIIDPLIDGVLPFH